MRNKKIDNAHRTMVKMIRKYNKSLNEDALFANRFVISEYSMYGYEFDDHSGAHVSMVIRVEDKLFGNKGYFSVTNFDFHRTFPEHLNDFIIRCESGFAGCYPEPYWYALDIHRCGNPNNDRFPEKEVKEMTYNRVSMVKDIE